MTVLREGSGARWLIIAASAITISALAVAAWFAMDIGGSAAVHDDDIFELEGDIVENGNAADGPDWGAIFNADGSVASLFGGVDAAFLMDDLSQASQKDDTIFAGSNKNNDLIATWNWDTGNNPPKDDFSNAYVWAARNRAGDLIIYTGLERLATEGESHVDVQFYREAIALDKSPPCGDDLTSDPDDGSPCEFVGEKSQGDLMVSMDFEKGGNLGLLRIYEWDATIQEYALVFDIPGEGCNPANSFPADTVCAFNSNGSGPIQGGPWPSYDRHGNVITELEPNQFTEVGVNVSELLGFVCINSVIAKTRTSQEITAELKDFSPPQAFDVCDLDVEKTGDLISKVGDPADYTITITNSGAVTLFKQDIIDSLLGDITIGGVDQSNPFVTSNTCGAELAPGASCTINLTYTVQPGDPDPLLNTVDVVYDSEAGLQGGEATSSSSHEVNLFQPDFTITKAGDGVSKIGDQVTYTFTIANTSSFDSPDLDLVSISDDKLGDLSAQATAAGCDVLTPETSDGAGDGEICNFQVQHTIPGGASDPYTNIVTATYSPDGFPNQLTRNDTHEVNLFGPDFTITKTGDELSKIGDQVTYTFTITNTSTSDSPDLNLLSISDDKLGDLSAAATSAGCDVLTTDPLETCVFQVQHTVPGSASDPYVNEVTVTYQVDGFPNQITHSTTHSLNLFQPSITLEKTGDSLSKTGDLVNYTITLSNTSSTDSPNLECTITDALLGINVSVTLASGGQHVINASRVVQSGDLDPLVNTADVTCSPIGFPNVLTATASHSVNLFQPGVDVTKTGDTLSKIGDRVTYDFTITNMGSHDSPNLLLDSVNDTVLGNRMTAANAAGCGTLAPETSDGAGDGESCSFSVDYTIQAQDPDPLVNVVTVHYHPDGFPNDISDSDDHSVNLFQPGVDVTKTGDTLSKVGDQVTYDFTITNTGSHDSPDLLLDSVSDTVLGFLTAAATAAGCGTLAPETSDGAGDGQSCSFSVDYTIQVQNPDPLVNVVTVNYHPEGFPNDISDSDSHSVNLFQPSVMVIKTGDTLSKVGDQVTYDFTILNNGSFDSPDLLLDSVSDTVLGNLTAAAIAAGCGTLAPETSDGAGDGESCSFSVDYTIQGQDPDPLVNVVTVHYHPEGFPNDISDSDDHSLNLFQPGVEVTKTGDELSKVGDQVTYDFTITNTGSHDSPDLVLDSVSDTVLGNLTAAATGAGCGALAPETSDSAGDGESCSFSVDYTIQGQDPDPLVNVVTVNYHPDGFPNDISDSDDHSLNLFQPDFTITKTGDELSKIGDVVTYTFTIANISSSDSPDLNLVSISDDKLGNLMTAATAAGCGTLAPETSDGSGD
ncbi:MAG: choice-of-anchor D domain-containing protein, partial [Chloroflexi bacterium]|nr:choice-of-anchor D domain-containing protein [Chloroflexota bacterium]